MNILHMKYASVVAKLGSLGKASEELLIAVPNLSRSIKELEADLGITIFERTKKGMSLTPEGEEFMDYARGILAQIEQVEKLYREGGSGKEKFSISVPRACYISDAFAEFSKTIGSGAAELFYKETNSKRAIDNVLNHGYHLGIIRYSENYDKYFKAMLLEKGLSYEVITEFTYKLIMSKKNPLSQKKEITFQDLKDYIEIAHADPFVPSLPLAKVVKEELPNNISRRIFVFERASQFDLLSKNPETFMWVSPVPEELLERYSLTESECSYNSKKYRDVLIYKNGYKLSRLDRKFIEALGVAKNKNFVPY